MDDGGQVEMVHPEPGLPRLQGVRSPCAVHAVNAANKALFSLFPIDGPMLRLV